MQMALPGALRCVLTCFLAQALLAPGVSVQSFLSSSSSLAIPDNSRVTTVVNLKTGVGIIRPPVVSAPAPAPAGNAADKTAPAIAVVAGGSANQGAVPLGNVGARLWQIEARFMMSTDAPVFTDEYSSSAAGLALTLADRLKWATDVPMSRFAFYLPDPAATVDPTNVLFCECSSNEHLKGAFDARYAGPKNATYNCKPNKYKMNATGMPSLLQEEAPAKRGITFEVGLYPPSGVAGDTKASVQVAQDIVENADSGDEPVRKLHTNGLWTYKAGPGVKFHGLFPATMVGFPGSAFPEQRDTSLPLGPNPGGHWKPPPPTPPPGFVRGQEADRKQNVMLDNVDVVVSEADKENTAVRSSLKELQDSLARASAAHSAWMNTDVYQLPKRLFGP